MKFNIIEKPKAVFQMSKVSFSDILEKEEMEEILGGASCGTYTSCSTTGRSSCEPFSCWFFRDSCDDIRVWVADPNGPVLLNETLNNKALGDPEALIEERF
ncbi:MAG: hypothetical protein LBI82_03915 [Dysgonamonadaceae bacterium]|jgi:hypothetical protein|nr:hypothetical protein [Dysgonamonadaceae bacterium]